MTMKLSRLLQDIDTLQIIGDPERNIESLQSDSRLVEKNGMFVAVRGTTTDGHKYIPMVASTHVGAIVCEELPSQIVNGITYIQVADTAEALGKLASAWYGHPSSKLKLVGVTGTNGKTTTATLLYEMARLEGYKAGLLSTVCNYVDGRAVPATHTTPDPLPLNQLLAEMVEADYAFMEVSSHAAHQKRIAGLKFKGGIFSNLTRDHLDYHGTVENYRDAKKMFFDSLPADAFALVNADARSGLYFSGRFNAYNLTAVFGGSILTGFPEEEVLVNMSRLVPVAGRFQTFRSADGQVTAIVDYAHTPDALVNVLDTIREIVGPDGIVTTVVGAGGNRDHGKRPMMAREAACRSDRLILTSDNPRDENPEDIINDMKKGLMPQELRHTLCITDRREAIRTALQTAEPGSVVLIAGKGHEPYQEVKGVGHHFDDREEVQNAFNEMK